MKSISELLLNLLLGRFDCIIPLEHACLCDACHQDGPLGLGDLQGNITGSLVDLIHRERASLGQFVLMAPEGECLRDVTSSSSKLYPQLLHSFWMFCSGFWSPHSSCGVSSSLQCVNITSISNNDFSCTKSLQQTLNI